MADIREDDGGFGNWFRAKHQKTETSVDRSVRLDELKNKNAKKLAEEAEKTQLPEWFVNVSKNCKGMEVKKNIDGDLYTHDKLTKRLVGIPDSRFQKLLKEGDII